MGSGAAQRLNGSERPTRAPLAQGRVAERLLFAAIAVGAAVFIGLGAPVCPSAGWLGVPCPGCGLTRAARALLTGNVGEALRLHPLVFVAAPALLALSSSMLLSHFRKDSADAPGGSALWARIWTWGAALLVAALLLVWVLRFLGYFGGPAPVTTYAQWWQQRGAIELKR